MQTHSLCAMPSAPLRCALLVVMLLARVVSAQVSGSIAGYVHDPSGAAVPNTTVTATMVEQKTSRSTKTNDEGFYNFVGLPNGHYQVGFEASGFEQQVQSGLELTVNQNLRVDAALALGAVGSHVTVGASAPLVDTVSPELSGLIDDRRVVDLPLNGRNVIGLAAILPGVLNVSAPQQMNNARGGPEMDVSGGRPNMNLFTFDGGYFNNPSRNTGLNFPPPDAIQEVRILTHNFGAEYGHNPGSQVVVVSKSGTNEFHGSVWEFLRNEDLNARNFFSPRVPAEKQNQFGGAAGAPILKDKLFIFGSYQGLRDHAEAQSTQAQVPLDAQRSGDFSGLGITLVNPTNPVTNQPFIDSAGRPCVAGNIVAPSCISPVAQALLKYVPQSSSGQVVSLAANPRVGDMYMFRGDWNQSEKHRILAHFFSDHNTHNSPFAGGGNLPGYNGETFAADTRQFTLNDTYAFRPNLLNQAVFTYLDTNSNELGTKEIVPSSIGVNMPQYVPGGAIAVNVGNNFNLGAGYPTKFLGTNYQIRDSLNWIKGRHSFKFGYELLHLSFRQIWIGSPNFYFSGARTGSSYADFLLGAFDTLSLDFGVRNNDDYTNFHSFYAQDEFKISRRLMLTYGVRYEPYLPWKDRNNAIDTVVPGAQSKVVADAPPGILFPGDLPSGLSHPDLNNFAPRVGLAWDVFGDGRTSVRAGYGFFYESINADSLAQENPPFAGFGSAYGGSISDPFGSVGLAAPPATTSAKFGCVKISAYPGYNCPLFPLPAGGVFTDPNLRSPYIQSFNLTLQRQVTPSLMVETGYAGKIGIKIEALRTYNPGRFINDPITGDAPSLQNVNNRVVFEPGILSPQGYYLGNDFRSWYHSFHVQVTKRFSEGLSVVGSYTLSKSIDSSSTDNLGATVANPFNLRQERGRSDWDRKHAFVASWLYSPPVHFKNHFANSALGGWTVTAIHSFQSGLPITFLMGDDVALDGTAGSQHAQLVPGATVSSIQMSHSSRGAEVAQFFQTNAFVPTAAVPRGVYGNSGRGLISGPAYSNTDMSLIKDFALIERLKLQLRAEGFNVFNQVNFDLPNSYVNSDSFGQITSAQSGRVIQVALKLLW